MYRLSELESYLCQGDIIIDFNKDKIQTFKPENFFLGIFTLEISSLLSSVSCCFCLTVPGTDGFLPISRFQEHCICEQFELPISMSQWDYDCTDKQWTA